LDVPIKTIQKRIAEDSTLKFLDLKHPAKNFKRAFTSRQKIYQELADLVIDPENKTTAEMVKIIEGLFYGK
jgi:shikimate kinase